VRPDYGTAVGNQASVSAMRFEVVAQSPTLSHWYNSVWGRGRGRGRGIVPALNGMWCPGASDGCWAFRG
jgi:hypothetical protein